MKLNLNNAIKYKVTEISNGEIDAINLGSVILNKPWKV